MASQTYSLGTSEDDLALRAREIGVEHRAAMRIRSASRYSSGAGIIISTRLQLAALAARGMDDDDFDQPGETSGRLERSPSWLEGAEAAIAARRTAQESPMTSSSGFTLLEAFFASIKSAVGPAVLYMPKGFQEGGLSFSLAMLLLSYALFGAGAMRLLECWRRHRKSYAALMGKAYGNRGTSLVRLTIVAQQCGICLTYFVFVAANARELFQYVFPHSAPPSLAICCVAQILLYVPLSCVRNVQNFAYFNLVANALILYSLVVLASFATTRVARLGSERTVGNLVLFNSRSFYLFVGTSAFIYEGSAALVVPLQEAVRADLQDKFAPLYLKTAGGIVFVYIIFGIVNWAAYGEDTETVLTLNLPDHSPWKASVQLAFLIAVVFTFPLQLFPAVQILRSLVNKMQASVVLRERAAVLPDARATRRRASSSTDYEPILEPTSPSRKSPRTSRGSNRGGSGTAAAAAAAGISPSLPSCQSRMSGNLARAVLVIALACVSILQVNSLDKLVALIGGFLGIPLAFVYPLAIHLRLVPDASRRDKIINCVCIFVGLGLGLACTAVSTAILVYLPWLLLCAYR